MGKLNSLKQNLTTQLTAQRGNLPTAAQNVNMTPGNTQADLITIMNEKTALEQQLESHKQALQNSKDITDLNANLQREIRKLQQQKISIPQNM